MVTYHFPYLYIFLNYQEKYQRTYNINSLELISLRSVLGALEFSG